MNFMIPWSSEGKPNPIVCRPALPMDTPEVMEFTRRIWEGEDYVPHVWAEWLQDPDGMLAVAECGGSIVGLGKLTKLSPSDWWMEGLRVHPDREGRGVASKLNNYLYTYWQRIGAGFLRLATSSSREPVKHLSKQKGFLQIGEFTTYKASTIKTAENYDTNPQFAPMTTEDVAEAVELLCDSSKDWLPSGLMNLGWKWAAPRTQHFEQYRQDDQVWWWRERHGLLHMVQKSDDSENVARIRMLACSSVDVAALLLDARNFAGSIGYDQITWLAPMHPDMEDRMTKAGFKRDWEGSLLLFETQFPGA
jgi:GNAT superfamily N-acetyltransferase